MYDEKVLDGICDTLIKIMRTLQDSSCTVWGTVGMVNIYK
jgi:hypothetical protein